MGGWSAARAMAVRKAAATMPEHQGDMVEAKGDIIDEDQPCQGCMAQTIQE